MNILYIGPYRGPNGDGWSISSRKYLECLLMTEHNVISKPIYMAGAGGAVSNKIVEAEAKSFDTKPDIVIQHVLPDFFEHHDCYNIGLFFTETRHIEQTGWVEKINLLDEAWVGSPGEAVSLKDSGVKTKISVIPIPYREEKITEANRFNIQELENKYVFYFIGEHTERKNILALVQAFHREFLPHEDVSLLIKTSTEQLTADVNLWKQQARLRKTYIPEVIITGNLTSQDIQNIHRSCQCFVCTSNGEAFCMPILDALYHNNRVICTRDIFPASLFASQIDLVPSYEQPVMAKQPPIPHIYTAAETWHQIDILELQRIMREAYEDDFYSIVPKAPTRQFVTDNFSYKTISKKMNACLLSVTL